MDNIYINKLSFRNSQLELKNDSIVCLVGPNNSGKSSSLRTISNYFGSNKIDDKSHIKEITIAPSKNKEEWLEYITSRSSKVGDQIRWFGGSINVNQIDQILKYAVSRNWPPINSIFFQYLDARSRFSAVDPAPSIDFSTQQITHPIQKMLQDVSIEKHCSDLCSELFGTEISVNPNNGSNIPIHIGKRVNPAPYGGDRSSGYALEVSKLPRIQDQGDGIQAVMGLLLQIVTSGKEIFAIDEPDLYLHPPQAYSVAKLICREAKNKQIFVATHSSHFVRGLVESAGDRLKIIRLDHLNDEYYSNIADLGNFERISMDPILKYTNILESLFTEFTIVCEDESDCLLYQHIIENNKDNYGNLDLRWFGVHGKQNFIKTIKMLRDFSIQHMFIADFDLLSKQSNSDGSILLPLVKESAGDVDFVKSRLAKLNTMIESNAQINWSLLKINGIATLEAHRAEYECVREVID